jgi:hypothetical protein
MKWIVNGFHDRTEMLKLKQKQILFPRLNFVKPTDFNIYLFLSDLFLAFCAGSEVADSGNTSHEIKMTNTENPICVSTDLSRYIGDFIDGEDYVHLRYINIKTAII